MKKFIIIIIAVLFCNIVISQNKQIHTTSDSTVAKPNNVTSTSSSAGIVTDIDGNVYKTVTIGAQIWMKENLRVTRFSNGDTIKTTSPDTLDLTGLKSPKYQWAYNGKESNAAVYGRLYTWYVVTDSRNVCPAGWHVPSDEEFCILEDSVEPNSDTNCNVLEHRGINQGGFLKEAGTLHWKAPNTGADNRSTFSVLPAGIRYFNGLFHCLGTHGYFWTTTEFDTESGRSRRFYYDHKDVSRSAYFKASSLSVRCVKD